MVIGIPPRKIGPRLGWSVHRHQEEAALTAKACKIQGAELVECSLRGRENEGKFRWRPIVQGWITERPGIFWKSRSEEHTSELQSLRHLVCRLLLEKKKKIENNT